MRALVLVVLGGFSIPSSADVGTLDFFGALVGSQTYIHEAEYKRITATDKCCLSRTLDGVCQTPNIKCFYRCECYQRASDGTCHHCSCIDGGKSCD